MRRLVIATVCVTLFVLQNCSEQSDRVSFNRDIRPLFNQKCVACHGGVKRAGGLGLIFRGEALAELPSGGRAIVPGRPGQSSLLERVHHDDPALRMPFEGAPLSTAETDLLERWIAEGAEWESHWAFQTLTEPSVPEGSHEHPIDRFVTARFARQFPEDTLHLRPAAPHVLARRLSFDLTGLPPAPEFAEQAAHQQLTHQLTSPRFGEHWASYWLDLARYADSRGYERDRPREIWPYRDWVIRALNDDMPFDRFTVEQLAGDLLPDPNVDQLIATGFHRNTPSNGEGGTHNEEYRVLSVLDRVSTTYEVWQGLTMSCVQCHGHPYDPVRHEEFYQAYALFNQTADHDHVTEAPYVSIYHAPVEAKLDSVSTYLQDLLPRTQVQALSRKLRTGEPRIRPYRFEDVRGGVFTDRADEDFMFLRDGNSFALPPLPLDSLGGLFLSLSRHDAAASLSIHLDGATGPEVGRYAPGGSHWVTSVAVSLRPLRGEHALHVVAHGPEIAGRGPLFRVYGVLPRYRPPGEDTVAVARIARYIDEVLTAPDSLRSLVASELPPGMARATHVFERGNWLVHGAAVGGGVPDILGGDSLRVDDRLDFARYLVSDDNPLTARVIVNRVWAQLFGRGLVATVADFGSQGEAPSHPELLDHLAWRFSHDMGWSLKTLLRYIVSSKTYRQSSTPVDPAWLQRDPYNKWLARGPRRRLTAEQLRDQMLAVSGLLSDKMYGPGVYPPQPAGMWDYIPYSDSKWIESTGEDRYRRAVYTYLRRSVVHPTMTTFDGSNREVCLSERVATNTPLQALATLNDPAFVEGMVRLAERAVGERGNLGRRIDWLYRRALLRPVREDERAALEQLYQQAHDHYNSSLEDADRLTGKQDADLAATTLVVNAIFNLDEFLSSS